MAKKASTRKRAVSGPPITEASIKRLAGAEVFSRGESYFEGGAILKPARIGNDLIARCMGSSYEPYRVKVTFNKKGIASTQCTCPYEWGNVCKHVVALLLTHALTPEAIEVKPTLRELLAGAEREDLIAMIAQMVDRYPELYGIVDGTGIPDEDEYGYEDW